jgi:hypothetical protein
MQIPDPIEKCLRAIEYEKKKKASETHFVLNPKCKPPKVFLHGCKGN